MRATRDTDLILLQSFAGMAAGLLLDLHAGAWPILTSICGQRLPPWQSLPWVLGNLPASNAGMLLAPLLCWAVRRRFQAESSNVAQASMLHALLMAPAMLLGMNLAMAMMPTARGPLALQLATMALIMLAGMACGMSVMDTALAAGRRLTARKIP